MDPTTGNPATVAIDDAPAEEGNYVARALSHAQAVKDALGFAAEQPPEYSPDPRVQRASSGACAVHLQQLYKGIPVYGAARTVRFRPDGAIAESVGSTVTVDEPRTVQPKLTVEAAVRRAAEHVANPDDDEWNQTDPFGQSVEPVGVDVSEFEPHVTAAFTDRPELSSVLEPGPFGAEIKANLIWFPLEQLTLAWEVLLTLGDYDSQYRVIVDADGGEILLCKQLVKSVLGKGNVYRVHGGEDRQLVEFPIDLAHHGLPIPDDLAVEFPDPWIEERSAAGNCVFAHLDDAGPTLDGLLSDETVVFDPSDPVGDHQKILNIFFYNCVMHDYFYLLGFREREGNFQRDNLGRGGFGSDRVDARSFSGEVRGTATMSTPVDGQSPTMRMGLVTSTGRHTAFDSSVVFHEFMHGVTNRLVGGAMNVRALEDPQSSGMGEGWGDYVACTINNSTVVGDWVVDQPTGIREFPYDSDFPDTFADLGTGRYTEEHNIGEIWCAALLEMNRRIGPALGIQLVVDALKLAPANPSFLDMRDAILASLDSRLSSGQLTEAAHGDVLAGVWRAFAKFGMGPGASSDGAFLSGIVADFTLPPGIEPLEE